MRDKLAEAKFKTAQDLGMNAALFDFSGNLLDIHIRRQCGRAPNLTGTRWVEFVHADDAPRVMLFFNSTRPTTSFRFWGWQSHEYAQVLISKELIGAPGDGCFFCVFNT